MKDQRQQMFAVLGLIYELSRVVDRELDTWYAPLMARHVLREIERIARELRELGVEP